MIRAPTRIWAPRASGVALEVDGARFDLVPADDGFFSVPPGAAARLVAGARYGLSLDGGPLLPDPRSRDQPDGVLGLSRVVDDAWPWTDEGFAAAPLASAVLYELHVGTFSPQGTFAGVVERLDHLEALGVTHVELMPLATFDGERGWGYDGVALFAPHASYGGPDGLRALVDACHARGLAVVIDVVYNHLGPSGNVLGHYGPYLAEQRDTPWGGGVNVDGRHSDEVRAFFIDNARMWLEEYHADALRLDAVHGIVDGTALPFLEELAAQVAQLGERLGRPLALIAESDLNDPRLVTPREHGGFGLDAQWSDDLHHALHVALTGERTAYYRDFDGLGDLARVLACGWAYEGQRSVCRARRHGRPLPPSLAPRLVGYAQNHDQVGNRAGGERLAAMVGVEGAQVALAIVLFAPFVPLLFQGEEWGARTPFLYFADHKDAALADAVRRGREAELAGRGWRGAPDPGALSTWERSRVDWASREGPESRAALSFTQALIALRRTTPALLAGSLAEVSVEVDVARQWLRVERSAHVLVVNLGPRQLVPVRGQCTLLVSSREGVVVGAGAAELPADCAAVLVRA